MMKVRTGFVSNSSTSSFCVFGTEFDTLEAVAELFKIEPPIPEKGCDHAFDRLVLTHCPECDEPAYYKPEIDEEWISMSLPEDLCLIDKRYAGYRLYLGCPMDGQGQELINSLTKTNKLIKDLTGKEAHTCRGAYEDR
jgi:hypothetical protein